MTDTALLNAQQRIADIDSRTSDLNAQISATYEVIKSLALERERLEGFVRVWHELVGTQMSAEAAQAVDNVVKSEKPRRVRPKNPDRLVVVDAALGLIREIGRPIGRRALYDALKARGIEIHGKDPEMVLSTMLWRSPDRVVRLPAYGYWDAEQSYPDADYISSLAS